MIVKWFSDNLLKLNDEKCHLMVFVDKNTEVAIKTGNSEIKESDCQQLLGITFDKNLNFKRHIEDLCRKANQKIHALARLSNYIDPVKSEILMNSFIISQFNYCPIVWMFSDKATNAKLNCTFEKAQRLVSKGSELKLKQIKEKSITIHQHNLQLLMVEIFKTKNNLNSTFMKNVFTKRDVQYNLNSKNHLQLPNIRTAKYGIENIQYIGHDLWASLSDDIEDSGTLINFTQKIKS